MYAWIVTDPKERRTPRLFTTRKKALRYAGNYLRQFSPKLTVKRFGPGLAHITTASGDYHSLWVDQEPIDLY